MSEKEEKQFVISQENWSLHRKGYQDQQRHMDKVKEAIKDNLPDLISEESIIMSNGRDVIKIPIRSLDEYKIRYNYDKTKHVGQGDGDSQVGDVIAKGSGEGEDGQGKGKQAGDQAGKDYYEAEVTIEELETALFKEMELPNLQQKEQMDIVTDKVEFNDIRKKGLMGNIDKKRTIITAIKRNAMKGKAEITPIHNDDLRFKTWDEVVKPESKAVVLAMMDTSGSMGAFEKYCARSFFFWMARFLRTKYETVEIEFIAHHTEAKVVPEEAFFSKGESGGTICSSAYLKALELIREKYNPARYNIYPVHFSDGENMTSDNEKCMKLVNELMDISSMFGYGEVNAHSRYSTLMNTYKKIDNPKFRHYVLKENRDVYQALKSLFRKYETST
ncbi:sporulation protein YhbH [Psychrobacillus sp. NEAU-3TGS]|uniref:sporulation protein YhbH n=1 Tax=Psychrobacillus sp. NEAU-3TGS TaxID=2995412 RepID=UPI002497259A|nr:sporulation protein YhbH [Psychrobacillus sp. NEAU-3TGS]MDI2586836.1 sporulation protein YhbH [Psychrobacillus sp. NEAU-3TGS]